MANGAIPPRPEGRGILARHRVMTLPLTSTREIRDALLAGEGRYDGPDSYAVRVRHLGGHRSGDNLSEHWGDWPRRTAEQIADVLAREYGGTVSLDARAITVTSGRNVGGRPPVGPLIALRFPPPLVDRLDARARETGETRSALIRRGAELALAATQAPARTNGLTGMISVRLPSDLIEKLDAHKGALGTTRTALLCYGAELVLADGEG